MVIKRVGMIRNEEIRAMAGVANISENIRDGVLRWIGLVWRKTADDVVMRTWKAEVGGHRHIGTPNRDGAML